MNANTETIVVIIWLLPLVIFIGYKFCNSAINHEKEKSWYSESHKRPDEELQVCLLLMFWPLILCMTVLSCIVYVPIRALWLLIYWLAKPNKTFKPLYSIKQIFKLPEDY